MVMRTIFDIIDVPPKFNADYMKETLPRNVISLELLLIASSLLANQTFQFDSDETDSANHAIQLWQDKCIAAGKHFS